MIVLGSEKKPVIVSQNQRHISSLRMKRRSRRHNRRGNNQDKYTHGSILEQGRKL